MKIESGINECFFCRQQIKWTFTKPDYLNNLMYSVTDPENAVCAEETAVDKGKHEIIVTCPHCRTKNRFTYESS